MCDSQSVAKNKNTANIITQVHMNITDLTIELCMKRLNTTAEYERVLML